MYFCRELLANHSCPLANSKPTSENKGADKENEVCLIFCIFVRISTFFLKIHHRFSLVNYEHMVVDSLFWRRIVGKIVEGHSRSALCREI